MGRVQTKTEKGKPGASRGRKARGLTRCEIARLPVHTMEGAYVMKQCLFSTRFVKLGVVLAAIAVLPVQAASADSSSCTNPLLSQPFLSYGDHNWFTLAPGESVDNVNGAGWILSGGARLVTTTVADRNVGSVVDLPPGSSARTPVMCVESGMP